MNTKPLTFSLSLTFLFLFSGSVYGDDFQDGMDAANKGDDKEAVRLFRLSAAEGNATAQHNLGYMYAIGQGAPQDYKEAFKWYRIAAEQGLPQAQGQIGHMYIQGMGVKKDFDAAFKWFRLAAEKGDSFSQNSLGVMYAEGIGVGKNDKEALNWFRFAAQNGNEYSIKRLTSLGLWNSADNKPICSREDNEYSLKMDGVEANEAFIFGLKVQQIVREKDLKALFSLVDGELILGPRRSFIKGKEFNDLFSEEWQKKVLETPPECRPVGWRGFMIGHGKIWYRIAHGKLNIFSITGAVEEIPRKQVKEGWLHEGRELEGSCFTTIWYSGDNYEHFHDTYAEAENYQIFSRFIGKYIGKQIPLKAVPSPWDKGTLELAVNLSHCSKTDDEKTYEVLKEIPRTYCKSLAPNFSQECDHIRLIKVSGPCGGSMGCSINTALYAIVDEQKTKNSYMVPLVNFDSENDALNYVDKLIANPPETSAKVVNNEQAHSVVPTEDCSAWTSQKFAGEFIQKNLTIEKSPDKISEKMLYFKKLVENIPNNCLMDFTDSVQFENDKSTTPSLDQKCSVLGSLVALLNTSKINYIRTIKTHDCLFGITFAPPPFEGRPESMEPFWIDNKWVWRNRSTGELLVFPDQKDCRHPQPFGLPCVGDKPPIPYAKGKVFPWKPWRPSQERKNSTPEDSQQRVKKNSKTTGTKNEGYKVTLGIFETKILAEKFRAELLKKGLTPNIEQKENEWKLFIGPYPSEELARQAIPSNILEIFKEIEVVAELKTLAEKGDVESQSVLGYMYVTGTGVKQNLIEAQKWLKQAGEKGSDEAQYNLGLSYAEGDGQSKNYKESLKWYELAAKQGNPYALNNIGWMYEVGQGVSQDKEEAIKWYRLASDKDDEVARRNISASFLNGKGKPRSYQEPIRHMHITAEYGDSKAMHKLGKMYALGEGVDQDYGAALKWFRQAAEEGNSYSQYNLGVMYEGGMGVEKDDEESLKWFRLSAKEGNENAVERLMELGLWDSDSPNGNSKGDLSAKVEVLDRNPLEEKNVHEIPAAGRSTYSAYADEPKGYPDTNNSVKVNYKNIINGMAVEAVWEPIDTQGSSVLGEAIIKFTNVKNGESFTIYNSHFGLSKDSVKELNIEWNDERGRIKFDKKNITLKYVAPLPFKDDLGDAPFFFFDIDFDGKDELIVEGRHQGQRGMSTFKVYVLKGKGLAGENEQITDDEPYLELDARSIIQNGIIKITGSSGACNGYTKTYRRSPPRDGYGRGEYNLNEYTVWEWEEDGSCKVYTYRVDQHQKLKLISKKILGSTPSPTINNKSFSPSKIPQDKTYYDSLSQLAKEGDAEAQLKLGYMHDKGEGVPQDYKEAINWYRLSAEQGNIDAKEKLSFLLADSKDARDYFEKDTSKDQNVVESSPLDFYSKEKSVKNHSNHFSSCTKEKVNFIEFKSLVIYPVKATLTCLLSPLSSTKPRLKSKMDWKFDRDVTDNQLAELDSSDKDVLLLYDSMFDGGQAESVYPLEEGLIRHSENGQAIVFTAPESDVGVTHIKQISSEYIVVRASSHTWQSAYLVSTDLKQMSYLTNGSVEVVNLDKLIFKSRGRKSYFNEAGGAFWYNAIIDRNGEIIDIDNEDLDPAYKSCFSKSDFLKKSDIKLPESARDIVCVGR